MANMTKGARDLAAALEPRMTKGELSAKLGVSRGTIRAWLAGESYPDADQLRQMTELFGIDMARWGMPDSGTVLPSDGTDDE